MTASNRLDIFFISLPERPLLRGMAVHEGREISQGL
jgi:hypothetical protein